MSTGQQLLDRFPPPRRAFARHSVMLSAAQVSRIRALASERVPQRVIALRVGCCRATVAAVLARPDDAGTDLPYEENPLDERRPWRCPGCRGALISAWCLACRLRTGRVHRRPGC